MQNQDSPEAQGSPAEVVPTTPLGSYEFSAGENVLFKGLALRMSSLGFLLLVLAALDIPSLLNGNLTSAFMAVLFTVTGTWTFFTAYSVRSIVNTEGSDISHLMAALTSLLHLLTMGVILVVVLVGMSASGSVGNLLSRFL